MDRERIENWLTAEHRTFRWTDGEGTHYEAVETVTEGLRWYRWSHLFEGPSGISEESLQSYDAFRANGPVLTMPKDVQADLEAWVQSHVPQ